jgi:magnesium transporter
MPAESIKTDKLTWVNITHAGKKEIDYLAQNFKFHSLDLEDSYASRYAQRPKINEHSNYLFLILLFPFYSRKRREIVAGEIDFFITPDHLITVHNEELIPLINFFNLCKINGKEKDKYLGQTPAKLLYEILNRLLLDCFPMLDHISLDIGNIEKKIFAGFERQMVKEILVIKRNIVNFRKTMQAHKDTIKKIIRVDSQYFLHEHLIIYYKDLIDHTKNIWDILENQKETIDALEDTNSSLVSFKLNDIMRILTIFSVIVFPLTLFANIFGMNTISTPIIGNRFDFWIIISTMLIASTGMLIYFRRKRWL